MTRLADQLRQRKRGIGRLRRRVSRRLDRVTIDQPMAERALRDAGLHEGDAVFFQAGMSAIGRINEGPDTVISALSNVVGDRGLVAMPAFPSTSSGLEYARSGEVFDLLRSPSRMGAITDRFRTRPGVTRSLHPTHSIAARGPGAEELVAGHDRADTPFGEGTPFARLIALDALQVWFGCGVPIGPFTMYHAFECLRPGGFPLPVFFPEAQKFECIDAGGARRTVRTLVHDPRFADVRSRNRHEIRGRLREALLEAGVLRVTALGRGEVVTARLSPLIQELEPLLQRDVTIYDLPLAPSTDGER